MVPSTGIASIIHSWIHTDIGLRGHWWYALNREASLPSAPKELVHSGRRSYTCSMAQFYCRWPWATFKGLKNDYVFTLRYTSEQVCLMCKRWVDCRVHGAWSMIIDSAGVDGIIGTVESTSVCQPPQLTSVKHMHTTVVHWTHTKKTRSLGLLTLYTAHMIASSTKLFQSNAEM